MSARALVTILQRFEHVEKLLSGRNFSTCGKISFLGHCLLSVATI
jgi:hypothetical protein